MKWSRVMILILFYCLIHYALRMKIYIKFFLYKMIGWEILHFFFFCFIFWKISCLIFSIFGSFGILRMQCSICLINCEIQDVWSWPIDWNTIETVFSQCLFLYLCNMYTSTSMPNLLVLYLSIHLYWCIVFFHYSKV